MSIERYVSILARTLYCTEIVDTNIVSQSKDTYYSILYPKVGKFYTDNKINYLTLEDLKKINDSINVILNNKIGEQ